MGSNLHVHVKVVDVGLSEEDKDKFYRDFKDISDSMHIDSLMGWSRSGAKDFTLGMSKKTLIHKEWIVCPEPFYSLAVNFNGQVSICCVDWSMGTLVGDLRTESLKDIWFGESLKRFRSIHLEGRRNELTACANCSYLNQLDDLSNLDGVRHKLQEMH